MRSMLLSFVMLVALLAAAPAAAAIKCQSHTVPGVAYVIDGRLVAVRSNTEEAMPLPDRDDILNIEIRCFEVRGEAGAEPVRYSAIVISTRSGAAAMIESYLADLVLAQREHFELTGSYATRPEVQKFFDSRASFTLTISVVEGGWSAEGTLDGAGVDCRVAVGTAAAAADPALTSGVPVCTATSPGGV
jgi:hypothetical protein